jgi:undecaprenyl-diphosphatase
LRGLFLVLALLQPIERVDRDLVQVVQGWRQPWLDPVMGEISHTGRPMVLISGMIAIAVFDRAAGLRTALATLAVLAPVNLVVEGLKRAVGRVRPDGDRKRSNSSFPSSHAANAVALAWMLTRRWPRLAIPFGAAAALVTFSRIYLNRHFPSDLLVGAGIGLAFALLATRRFPALDPRRRPGPAPVAPAPGT